MKTVRVFKTQDEDGNEDRDFHGVMASPGGRRLERARPRIRRPLVFENSGRQTSFDKPEVVRRTAPRVAGRPVRSLKSG